MTLNIQKLKTEIAQTSLEILERKAILRESGQPRVTRALHLDLKALKYHATILCSLRAHSHGRIHCREFTAELQFELIQGAWEEYQLGESQEAAA